jgi:NhaA family Na+:H+ antiporter
MKRLLSIFKKAGDNSLPLILGIVLALVWANMDYDGYTAFWHNKIFGVVDLHFLVNDIFMVFFFALAGVEIVRALSPNGSLYPMKNAVSNLFATAGGVIVPAAVFFLLIYFFGHPKYSHGWAIPTATDIAISLLFARIVFGEKHPVVVFLIMLAVLDDAIGLAIIAVFYPDPSSPVRLVFFCFVLAAMLLAFIFNRMKIKPYLPYILIPGIISWFGMYKANLHPSLALIFILPFIPNKKVLPSDKTSLDKFEHNWKYFVSFGLVFFGLANAGVELTKVSDLAIIVFLSLLFGKTIGILGFAKLAGLLRFPVPAGIKTSELFIMSLIASVGLTVSLFISSIAYVDSELQDAAKMGALFSLLNGFTAVIAAKVLLRKKPAKE